LRYKPLQLAEQKFGEEKTVSLAAVEYKENPNYLSKIIEIDGKRIGYYVYNFFATGTQGNTNAYEANMAAIFENFKANEITDLVLDLRFNSGGSETAANSLASYIGSGIDNTKIFARRAYNPRVEKAITDDPEAGPEFLITKFVNKASNIGSSLSGGRLYVLTSSRTASASELIINALKPFMEVFLIGDTTYGKNVGSITLNDEEDPTNRWGLQPIVVKVYNSLDQSDYGNGFSPQVIHKDNSLYLYPLGDQKEALLSLAIGQITGTATAGRVPSGDERREIIGHSLDMKQRSFNLVIDENVPVLKTLQ
jgi:carboxyl-terminal processing protease